MSEISCCSQLTYETTNKVVRDTMFTKIIILMETLVAEFYHMFHIYPNLYRNQTFPFPVIRIMTYLSADSLLELHLSVLVVVAAAQVVDIGSHMHLADNQAAAVLAVRSTADSKQPVPDRFADDLKAHHSVTHLSYYVHFLSSYIINLFTFKNSANQKWCSTAPPLVQQYQHQRIERYRCHILEEHLVQCYVQLQMHHHPPLDRLVHETAVLAFLEQCHQPKKNFSNDSVLTVTACSKIRAQPSVNAMLDTCND